MLRIIHASCLSSFSLLGILSASVRPHGSMEVKYITRQCKTGNHLLPYFRYSQQISAPEDLTLQLLADPLDPLSLLKFGLSVFKTLAPGRTLFSWLLILSVCLSSISSTQRRSIDRLRRWRFCLERNMDVAVHLGPRKCYQRTKSLWVLRKIFDSP